MQCIYHPMFNIDLRRQSFIYASNAVCDGLKCLIYPIDSVRVMCRLILRVERQLQIHGLYNDCRSTAKIHGRKLCKRE